MNVENATKLVNAVRFGEIIVSDRPVTFNMNHILYVYSTVNLANACILGFAHLLSGGELRFIDPYGSRIREVINNVANWLDIEPDVMEQIAFPDTVRGYYEFINRETAADFLDAVLFKNIEPDVAESILAVDKPVGW